MDLQSRVWHLRLNMQRLDLSSVVDLAFISAAFSSSSNVNVARTSLASYRHLLKPESGQLFPLTAQIAGY